MAFLAIGSQLVVVWIIVAAIAVLKGNPRKSLKLLAALGFFLMAFGTGNRFVLSCEWKVCFIVVEVRCGRKIIGVVALGTIGGKGLLVVIIMAGKALLFQTQKGSLPLF